MLPSHPTPRQLFRSFDLGEISREQLRESMAEHARMLIQEMDEVHQNPLAAWVETLKNRQAASRLAKAHGEPMVRELFVALSEVPDFPLANWLWNADRDRLPLYCFLRSGREPVFRVKKIVSAPFVLTVTLEYGSAKRGSAVVERFVFQRDRLGRLVVQERQSL